MGPQIVLWVDLGTPEEKVFIYVPHPRKHPLKLAKQCDWLKAYPVENEAERNVACIQRCLVGESSQGGLPGDVFFGWGVGD